MPGGILKKDFGLPGSRGAGSVYTLTAGELSLSLCTLGAAWVSLTVPSRRGEAADILLGCPSPEMYAENPYFFGASIGRFANRIGRGRFSLNGRAYTLDRNDGEHCLHGGSRGFHTRLWEAEAFEDGGAACVRFGLESPDGDGGFPGRLRLAVTYRLTQNNEITADYQAEAGAPSPVNITNHAYFNLAGAGNILAHEFVLYASARLEADASLLPTGKLLPVEGGPFDFRQRKPAGRDIDSAGGYDHCFVIDGPPGTMRPCAEVFEESSGRRMKVFTTQPGLQFYTGNFLAGAPGKGGRAYTQHAGFCLETQHFPDSPNRPEFPSAIFGPSRDYQERALFGFDW
jgi:aldose 1-epimerase